jgi:hypothetical protein
MRKGTLITGIILVIIGVAVVGYHLWDMERTETAEIHHYAAVHFDAYLGDMTVYVSWTNQSTGPNATQAPPVFYVVLVAPYSCANLTEVVASSSGATGSMVVQFNGPHDWYAVLCDSSDEHSSFLLTYHQFAPTYYLIAGIGVSVLGGLVIILGWLQQPTPPISLRYPRKPVPPVDPPPA